MLGRKRLVGMELFCARAGESAAFYAWLLSSDAESGSDSWEPIRLLFERGVLSVRRADGTGPAPMWIPVYLVDNVEEAGRRMKQEGGHWEQVEGRTYLIDAGGVWTRVVAADAIPFGVETDAVSQTVMDYITTDVPRLAASYARVLRLDTVEFLDDEYGYQVLVDGKFVAMGLADYHTKAEAPVPHPSWMLYFDVPDVEASLARAVKAGARVVIPPVHEDYNTWTVLTDPFGVTFGLSTYHDLATSQVRVMTESGQVMKLGEAARLN